MSKVLVSETNLTAIADAIRGKNGSTETYKPGDMATAISAISSGSSGDGDSGAVISTNDHKKIWAQMVISIGDNIQTQDLTDCTDLFYNLKDIEDIPFEINCKAGQGIGFYRTFLGTNIKEVPKINNATPRNMELMFSNCQYLKYIPDDFNEWFTWSDEMTALKNNQMFQDCYSLRSIPTDIFNHCGTQVPYFYLYPYFGFKCCYVLDELTNLPMPNNYNYSSNIFQSAFDRCSRLKELTFAVKEDGTPYTMNWKNQTINLAMYVGYAEMMPQIRNYNSGITGVNGYVSNSSTYTENKDHPDYWTISVSYSRYNKQSALNTINSLPDTSAYLAANGGTNTIKFKGVAGASTDAGAINTLTEEEIAVAIAKGWTVSFL